MPDENHSMLLLWDAENMGLSEEVERELILRGRTVLKIAVGNWKKLGGLDSRLTKRGWRLVQSLPGKDSADLAIAALCREEMARARWAEVVLVSTDGFFDRLAAELVSAGCQVTRVKKAKTTVVIDRLGTAENPAFAEMRRQMADLAKRVAALERAQDAKGAEPPVQAVTRTEGATVGPVIAEGRRIAAGMTEISTDGTIDLRRFGRVFQERTGKSLKAAAQELGISGPELRRQVGLVQLSEGLLCPTCRKPLGAESKISQKEGSRYVWLSPEPSGAVPASAGKICLTCRQPLSQETPIPPKKTARRNPDRSKLLPDGKKGGPKPFEPSESRVGGFLPPPASAPLDAPAAARSVGRDSVRFQGSGPESERPAGSGPRRRNASAAGGNRLVSGAGGGRGRSKTGSGKRTGDGSR